MQKFAPLLLLATLIGCASRQPPPQTIRHVDLPAFMGEWYVIAMLPWFAERGHVNTRDIYALRPDGLIDVTYAFRKNSLNAPQQQWKARARVLPGTGNAHWKVQFLWPFWADYLVLYLSEDSQVSVIGHPSRRLAWIMARNPAISENELSRATSALAAQGFPTARLQRVPQPIPATPP